MLEMGGGSDRMDGLRSEDELKVIRSSRGGEGWDSDEDDLEMMGLNEDDEMDGVR